MKEESRVMNLSGTGNELIINRRFRHRHHVTTQSQPGAMVLYGERGK